VTVSNGVLKPLSAAELRVLRMLDSHRSHKQIGTELCLSPNTVKTHAGSLYRKLGVSRRAQAIERARALGILEA
jgi:LuxR family transcriptional regulator, maltose regulon positive regulatory protein